MHRFGRSRCRRRSSIHCPRARLGPVLGTTHRKEAEDSDNNGRGMVIIPSERQCLLHKALLHQQNPQPVHGRQRAPVGLHVARVLAGGAAGIDRGA